MKTKSKKEKERKDAPVIRHQAILDPETERAIQRAAKAARKLAEKYGLSPTVRSA